jgi:hypothetical protein
MCVTDLITNPLVPFPFAFARLNALQAAVDILTVWIGCLVLGDNPDIVLFLPSRSYVVGVFLSRETKFSFPPEPKYFRGSAVRPPLFIPTNKKNLTSIVKTTQPSKNPVARHEPTQSTYHFLKLTTFRKFTK